MERFVHKADFERVLATRSRSRSTHFAVHHVVGSPVARVWLPKKAEAEKLSTGPAPLSLKPVDDLPDGLWFACVVPKRHARRAVTRSLVKRQVRGAFERLGAGLPAGLWLVRLRAPFATTAFVSARSKALVDALRVELDGLLGSIA